MALNSCEKHDNEKTTNSGISSLLLGFVTNFERRFKSMLHREKCLTQRDIELPELYEQCRETSLFFCSSLFETSFGIKRSQGLTVKILTVLIQ